MTYKIDIQWRKINKPKSWQFERINKIHKHLTKLIYKKRNETQVTHSNHEKDNITTNSTDLKKIMTVFIV